MARESDAFDFVAWKPESQTIVGGGEVVASHEFSAKMKVFFCGVCGSGLYHTNRLGVHSVSRSLFRHANGGSLPSGLEPQLHIHYGERVVDIADALPKFKDLPEPFGGSGELA